MAEDLNWTLGNVDSLVEVLSIRDMCHHLDEGQILIATDVIRSFDYRRLLTGSQKSRVGRRPFNAFDVNGRIRIWIINVNL